MSDKFRMVHWLGFAAVFYGAAMLVFGSQPQLQTLCWKLGNLTVASFAGYWIDRNLFSESRVHSYSSPFLQIRRAIIVAAAMLAVGMGL